MKTIKLKTHFGDTVCASQHLLLAGCCWCFSRAPWTLVICDWQTLMDINFSLHYFVQPQRDLQLPTGILLLAHPRIGRHLAPHRVLHHRCVGGVTITSCHWAQHLSPLTHPRVKYFTHEVQQSVSENLNHDHNKPSSTRFFLTTAKTGLAHFPLLKSWCYHTSFKIFEKKNPQYIYHNIFH